MYCSTAIQVSSRQGLCGIHQDERHRWGILLAGQTEGTDAQPDIDAITPQIK